MRLLLIFFVPLVAQVFAYIVVFLAAQGGGSFMGLLALPASVASVIALFAHGISSARARVPVASAMLISLGIALVPPVVLLVFRALES
ncbi:hypothetical protein [Variovorax sp. YR752]|uniref:hypothetical protein n=1 Tax=Variovorax sp. YR752 TaxID=1884383 RepID=UPI003137B1BE